MTTERTLRLALFALTFSTGLIDALSFLALGHVFTANMTGNIVFLAFAVAHVQGLSAARSAASLLAFMVGALCGGILIARRVGWTPARLLRQAIIIEAILLFAAMSLVLVTGNKPDPTPPVAYGLIGFTALAMGVRNAIVRKLSIPDLTTTVLTLTVTGLAADSSLAGGTDPRWKTRLTATLTMFVGAAAGALLLRYGVVAPLAVGSALAFVLFASTRVERAEPAVTED